MENIIELNGKKYLLFKIPIMNEAAAYRIEKTVINNKGIVQGVDKMHTGGFWGSPYVIINALIPEDRAFEFSSNPLSDSEDKKTVTSSFLDKFNYVADFFFNIVSKLFSTFKNKT